MKKFSLSTLAVALLLMAGLFSLSGGSALAATSYNPARLIDDPIFTDYSSMSTNQIQNFLSSMGSGLANYSEVENCGSSSGTHYSFYTQYYSCGKSSSAAKIIHDAANAYKISPKAIIATIQKEQSLITNPSPTQADINCAMGYNSCSGYSGFFYQVDNGSWQFRTYIELMNGRDYWINPNTGSPYTPANYPCKNGHDVDPSNNLYSTGLYPGRTVTFYDSGGTAKTIKLYNSSTAALYCYTPYVGPYSDTGYSGSYNFVVNFEAWFGSTQFPQPIGAALYRQSSTGMIFVTFTSSDGSTTTRYYIPSWSMMHNYGLDTYPTISADDATINAMTDGGSLTSLIRDGSGNVYLVDDGTKYYISSASICTAWGLDCFNSSVAHTLNTDFENSFLGTGNSLGVMMHYGGVYYKMENGQRRPFANNASINASGYSTSEALPTSSVNASQPLGKLIITTPGLIRFSPKPSIYYFDGSNFYAPDSMDSYNAWGLGGLNWQSVPTSSYNQSDDPTIASVLSQWYTDGTNKYIVDGSYKYKLSTFQANYWPGATYNSAPSSLVSRLSSGSLGSFIKSGPNYFQLSASNTKDYVPSLADLASLGGNSSNTTRVSSTLSNAVPNGPFALGNGSVVKFSGVSTIYVVYNKNLLQISSMDVLQAYHLYSVTTYSSANLSGNYPVSGALNFAKTSDGSVYFPYNGRLLMLTPHNAGMFGVNSSSFSDIDGHVLSSASPLVMTDFLRNSQTGAIYYGSGGALHYVSSMSAFYRYGGASTPLTSVNTAIVNSFVLAQPI